MIPHKIYVLDSTLDWKTYKLLQKKLVKESGPVPKHGDKILWKMLRAKQIYLWFDPKVQGDMCVGISLPKAEIMVIIKTGKK